MDNLSVWKQDSITHIDVRGLPPPQPMVAILSLLDQSSAYQRVIAHIDREPIFLYPELEELGWQYQAKKIDENYFQLELHRNE